MNILQKSLISTLNILSDNGQTINLEFYDRMGLLDIGTFKRVNIEDELIDYHAPFVETRHAPISSVTKFTVYNNMTIRIYCYA